MGVKGLVKYVTTRREAEGSWDRDFTLSNTRLVVDGNNLLHKLLQEDEGQSRVPYGGQYASFYTRACRFFSELQQHAVRPLVVMDGVKEPQKHETLKANLRDKLMGWWDDAKQDKDSIESREYIRVPLWAEDVFQEALVACGVAMVRTNFEADRSTAAVARHYECPVLSGDGDFLISDLPGGFVLSDRLDFEHPCLKKDRHGCSLPILFRRSLFALALQRTTLLESIGADVIERFLPLAAALSGNDYVPKKKVQHFYAHADWDYTHSIVTALAWILVDLRLGNMDDEKGLATLLAELPDSIHEGIRHSLRMYSPAPPVSSRLVQQCVSVHQLQEPISIDVGEASIPVAPYTLEHPGWFMELYHLGLVSPLPYLAYSPCPVRMPPCLECWTYAPMAIVDKPLRQHLLAMLSLNRGHVKVTELTRGSQRGSIHQESLHPVPLALVSGELISVANSATLDVQARRQCLLRALQSCTEAVTGLDESWQLVVASLRYLWCRSRELRDMSTARGNNVPVVTARHLKVLMAGVVGCCSQHDASSEALKLPCISLDDVRAMRASLEEWSAAEVGGRNNRQVPRPASPAHAQSVYGRRVVTTIVHVFNAWQQVVYTALQLNYALNMPFPVPLRHRIFDGVRNYSLFVTCKAHGDISYNKRDPRPPDCVWQALTAELEGHGYEDLQSCAWSDVCEMHPPVYSKLEEDCSWRG